MLTAVTQWRSMSFHENTGNMCNKINNFRSILPIYPFYKWCMSNWFFFKNGEQLFGQKWTIKQQNIFNCLWTIMGKQFFSKWVLMITVGVSIINILEIDDNKQTDKLLIILHEISCMYMYTELYCMLTYLSERSIWT